MLAADISMDISPSYFVQALPAAVKIGNLGLAMAKSVVFGVHCAHRLPLGLRVKPNTQSLGEGTTASVVSSITMVILVDALFAVPGIQEHRHMTERGGRWAGARVSIAVVVWGGAAKPEHIAVAPGEPPIVDVHGLWTQFGKAMKPSPCTRT